METLFFIICSGFFGYIYQKLEKLEAKIDQIEDEVIVLRHSAPKRKEDHVDYTLE
jgi:ribosome-associated translation inhibitor RaiA